MTLIEKIDNLDKEIKKVFLLENEVIHPKVDMELKNLASQHVLLKEHLSSLIADKISIRKANVNGDQQALLINNMNNHHYNDSEVFYTTYDFFEKEKKLTNVSSLFSPQDKFEPRYRINFFVILGKIINNSNTKHVNYGENYSIRLVNDFLEEDFKNFYQQNKKAIKENNHFIFNMTLLLMPLNEIKFNLNSIFEENKLYSKKDVYNILNESKEIIMINTDIDISTHLNKLSIFDPTKNMSKP